jgi:hypothetical protein
MSNRKKVEKVINTREVIKRENEFMSIKVKDLKSAYIFLGIILTFSIITNLFQKRICYDSSVLKTQNIIMISSIILVSILIMTLKMSRIKEYNRLRYFMNKSLVILWTIDFIAGLLVAGMVIASIMLIPVLEWIIRSRLMNYANASYFIGIIIFVLIPYILTYIIDYPWRKIIEYMFKLILKKKVDLKKYKSNILLFFRMISYTLTLYFYLTYNISAFNEVESGTDIKSIMKEAGLTFVLVDTIIDLLVRNFKEYISIKKNNNILEV